MPVIKIVTIINAPIEKVFDLSRSIDLHKQSMQHTNEKAIAGKMSGLIEEGESVTWEAKHFFKTRRLTSKITAMNFPTYFQDVMIEGDFAMMEHDHHFISTSEGTEMQDVFFFKAPYGIIGKLAEPFLKAYLRKLLIKRNAIIKTTAEQSTNVA